MNDMNQVTSSQLVENLRIQLDDSIIDNWFKNFSLHQEENKFTVFFENSFISDWVKTHYFENIEKSLQKISGEPNIILILSLQDDNKEAEDVHIEQTTVASNDLTFDTFIVGRSNEMAYTAALKICENALKPPMFNPLFVYGEPGVGKSHLLNAIINKIRTENPKLIVYYMTAEQFMYTFIKALKENNIMSFKDQLRKANFFLVDDVQFMMGKGSTQEEFFHTFNFLRQEKCQIVLTSDKSPNQLEGLEDRLRSRLGGGLTIELHQPNYELRLSILVSKAESEGIKIENNVLEFLAQNIKGNVRDLEGAWTRLVTYSQWMNEQITLELVNTILQDSLVSYERKITLHDVQCAVCNYFQIELAELKGDKREKKITKSRHIAMFLCRELTNASSTDIGHAFGGKDHSSVLYAVEKIAKEQMNNFGIKNEIGQIKKLMGI